MKIITKIYCFLFRHDFVLLGKWDNGSSAFRDYECVRCGKLVQCQFDYFGGR